jgi:hypothetical protein
MPHNGHTEQFDLVATTEATNFHAVGVSFIRFELEGGKNVMMNTQHIVQFNEEIV